MRSLSMLTPVDEPEFREHSPKQRICSRFGQNVMFGLARLEDTRIASWDDERVVIRKSHQQTILGTVYEQITRRVGSAPVLHSRTATPCGVFCATVWREECHNSCSSSQAERVNFRAAGPTLDCSRNNYRRSIGQPQRFACLQRASGNAARNE